jgi:hypothetical protein
VSLAFLAEDARGSAGCEAVEPRDAAYTGDIAHGDPTNEGDRAQRDPIKVSMTESVPARRPLKASRENFCMFGDVSNLPRGWWLSPGRSAHWAQLVFHPERESTLQLQERRMLKWGSPLFHYGTFAAIGGHVIGVLIPEQ